MQLQFQDREFFAAKSGVTADFGEKLRVVHWSTVSVQLFWTGTLTGTFTIWFSNKENPDDDVDADWTLSGITMPTQPAGSAGNMFLNFTGLGAAWLRVKYVHTSGTGMTVSVRAEAKP